MRSIARGAAPCTEQRDAKDDSSDWHPGSAGRTTGQLTLPRIEVRLCYNHDDQDRGQAEAHGHEAGGNARDRENELGDIGFLSTTANIYAHVDDKSKGKNLKHTCRTSFLNPSAVTIL